jgi:hypothetical protein
LDEVVTNPDLPWNLAALSRHMVLNLEQVLSTMGLIRWDFNELSANPSISLDDIRRTHHLPWNYERLSGP